MSRFTPSAVEENTADDIVRQILLTIFLFGGKIRPSTWQK